MKHAFLFKTSCLMICLLAGPALFRSMAQQVRPDSSFNQNGIIDSPDETANSMCPDAAGKVLVLGHDRSSATRNIFIKRYTSKGSADSSFGIYGRVEFDVNTDVDHGRCIKALSNGKYLVCGQNSAGPYFRPYVLRFNNDGSLDYSFGNLGITLLERSQSNADAWSFKVAGSGSIYLAGYRTVGSELKACVWKLKSNGFVDSGFGSNGEKLLSTNIFSERFYSIDLDEASNRLAAAGFSNSSNGTEGLLALMDTAGNLITGFNSGGYVKYRYNGNPGYLFDVCLKASQVVLAGQSTVAGNNAGVVCSYLLNGQLNTGFGTNGTYLNPNGIASYSKLLSDCKGGLYAGGYLSINADMHFLLSKLSFAGRADSAFGLNGHYTVKVLSSGGENTEAMALYGNNSILMGGRTDIGSSSTRSALIKLKVPACNSSSLRPAISAKSGSRLYPSLLNAGQTMRIEFSHPQDGVLVQLVSQTGQIIQPEFSENAQGLDIRTDGLAAGIYNCVLRSPLGTEVLGFVLE